MTACVDDGLRQLVDERRTFLLTFTGKRYTEISARASCALSEITLALLTRPHITALLVWESGLNQAPTLSRSTLAVHAASYALSRSRPRYVDSVVSKF